MGTNHGAVDDEVFQIRVIGEVVKHSLPNVLLAPAGEPLADAVPFAILGRKQSLLSTGPGDPQDTFDKAAAFSFLPHIHI